MLPARLHLAFGKMATRSYYCCNWPVKGYHSGMSAGLKLRRVCTILLLAFLVAVPGWASACGISCRSVSCQAKTASHSCPAGMAHCTMHSMPGFSGGQQHASRLPDLGFTASPVQHSTMADCATHCASLPSYSEVWRRVSGNAADIDFSSPNLVSVHPLALPSRSTTSLLTPPVTRSQSAASLSLRI